MKCASGRRSTGWHRALRGFQENDERNKRTVSGYKSPVPVNKADVVCALIKPGGGCRLLRKNGKIERIN